MSKVILITGVSGFVGSKMAARCISQGDEVHGILRRRADLKTPIKIQQELGDLTESLHLHYGDITNFHSLCSVLQKVQPDWIFHLASQSFVPESIRDPITTFEINAGGTQNLLEAVRLFSPKSRFIFAGSSEEYGLQFKDTTHFKKMKEKYKQIEPKPLYQAYWEEDDPDFEKYGSASELPINEENPLRPMSPYAVSKVFGDNLCRNYYNSFGLDCIISRAFNHEGAGRGDHFVTSSIVRQLCAIRNGDSDHLIVGDTSVTRDWSHVEDIIDGYLLLAEKAEPGSIYVQGTGIETSIEYFIWITIGEVWGDSPKPKFDIIHDPNLMRPSDVPNLQADPTKIRALGFKNKHNLTDIIRDQITYYSDKKNRQQILA